MQTRAGALRKTAQRRNLVRILRAANQEAGPTRRSATIPAQPTRSTRLVSASLAALKRAARPGRRGVPRELAFLVHNQALLAEGAPLREAGALRAAPGTLAFRGAR
jgi:hypothetical protein